MWCWKSVLHVPCTYYKDTQVGSRLDRACILSLWAYIMRRQNFLEKIRMSREGSKKRGRTKMSWISSIKEVMVFSLQGLGSAVNNSTFCRSLIHRVTICWKQDGDTKQEQHLVPSNKAPLCALISLFGILYVCFFSCLVLPVFLISKINSFFAVVFHVLDSAVTFCS